MNRIEAAFAEYFEAWDIQLPSNAAALQQPGKILKAGWHIKYVFGKDHLDFFAEHRMTNPRHGRIYSDGRYEALEAPREWCVTPAGADEAAKQQAWEEYYAYNRRVYTELRAKGLSDPIDQTLPTGDGLTAPTARPSPQNPSPKGRNEMTDAIFRIRTNRVEDASWRKDLTETWFAERGFWEEDIEEWLEKEPRLLGEDLLVIQRQADPVEAGNLYPDLVAVDRDGALVIVELKQDWSGYDIYWQASVYAAAYWKRTADEIIDLYGQYLQGARWRVEEGLKHHTGIDLYGEYQGDEREKAVERLIDHTRSRDVEDLKKKLNHRQRLVLVAHCFYQSAATAVLWLKERGLDVTCLRPDSISEGRTDEGVLCDHDTTHSGAERRRVARATAEGSQRERQRRARPL